MSEIFEMDVNGDGVDDLVVAEEYADGSIVTAADTDGDGVLDVAAYDANGDGVPEIIVEEDPGATAAPYAGEPTYAGEAAYAGDYAGGETYTDETYADPAFVSDMLATQHETSMAIINNI